MSKKKLAFKMTGVIRVYFSMKSLVLLGMYFDLVKDDRIFPRYVAR